jgi:hypothetical protein
LGANIKGVSEKTKPTKKKRNWAFRPSRLKIKTECVSSAERSV